METNKQMEHRKQANQNSENKTKTEHTRYSHRHMKEYYV